MTKNRRDPVPFSRSPCWELLRKYYQKEGPKAWDQKIPYHVTSNMNVAYAYAELLVAYYLDWTRENGASSRPLHILELGTGSGRFSYYLLIALEEVASINKLDPKSFKLIMSDFVEDNIKSWLGDKQFAPYFKKGMLDCMQFDAQTEPSMMCLYSRGRLMLEDFSIPPFVLGHYVLDSLPIDVFRVKKGSLYAVHVGLSTIKKSDYKKDDIRRIQFDKKLLRVKDKYYKNEFHNELLTTAAQEIEEGYFDFPVAAFRMFDALNAATNGQFVFSCMDKGYVSWGCYKDGTFPPIFYHDNTFSFDVNFCMLAEYLNKKEKHQLWHITTRQVIKWALCGFGVELKDPQEIKRFIQIRLEQNSPSDYIYFYQMACDEKFDLLFSALLSMLAQSNWDPMLFAQMGSALVKNISDATLDERNFLFSHLETLERNFFNAVDSGDIYFVIGKLYNELGLYDEAVDYFERSIKVFGESYRVYFALGKSYFSAGDSAKAFSMFSQAQKYKVTKQLKSWLDYFGRESTYKKVKEKLDERSAKKEKKNKGDS